MEISVACFHSLNQLGFHPFIPIFVCIPQSKVPTSYFPSKELIKPGGMEIDVDTLSGQNVSGLFDSKVKVQKSSILYHPLTERLQVRERDGQHRSQISRPDLLCSDFVLFIVLVHACDTDKRATVFETFSTKGHIRLINCLIFRRNRSF